MLEDVEVSANQCIIFIVDLVQVCDFDQALLMPLGVHLDIIRLDHVTIFASLSTFANGAKPTLHDQHNEHADEEVTSQCHHIAAHIGHLVALKGDIGPHWKAGQSILVHALGKSSAGASRSCIEDLSWSVLSSLI